MLPFLRRKLTRRRKVIFIDSHSRHVQIETFGRKNMRMICYVEKEASLLTGLMVCANMTAQK